MALWHEVGKHFESSDLLKKNQHGVFYMNFYMDAVVDTLIQSTILQPEIDQKTQENTSIVELFMMQPEIQAQQGAACVLYACDLTCNGHIHTAGTT